MVVDAASAHHPQRRRVLAGLAIVLTALNLRGAATVLSPIVDVVSQDIPLGALMQGVLGALPQLLFAAAGVVTPLLVRGMPLPVLSAVAMLVTAGAQVLRASIDSGWAFACSTGLIFLAIGVGNIVAPPTIRLFFPHRVGFMTSAYSISLGLSTALPPVYIVALTQSAGWRIGLASWAFPALLAAALWGLVILRSRRALARSRRLPVGLDPHPHTATLEVLRVENDGASGDGRPVQVWRTWQGWGIAVMMAAQSTVVYAMFTWLPALLRDAGVESTAAALGLAWFTGLGMLLGLVIPPLASRQSTLRPMLIVSAACFTVGLTGLMIAPDVLTLVWISALGLGPLTFCIVLVLIPLRARTQTHAAQLSAFVQGVGYLIAAAGPFVFGLLHSLSGGWTMPLAYLMVCVAVSLPFAVVGTRPGYVGDVRR